MVVEVQLYKYPVIKLTYLSISVKLSAANVIDYKEFKMIDWLIKIAEEINVCWKQFVPIILLQPFKIVLNIIMQTEKYFAMYLG